MLERSNWMERKEGKGSRLVGLVLFLMGTAVALAQLPTATILGVVRDSSGAIVPEATLTARNAETGQTRAATSASDGSYRFAALPVGRYEVRVERPGFRSEVRSGLTLTVGQEAVVNFALAVGAIEQTVEVTAEAPLVNTTSGSLGGLVDEQKVAELPLNGRNYVDLAFLQTGVTIGRSTSASGGASGGGAAGASVWFSSNGAPVRSNNFMLDGAIMQSAQDAGTGTLSRSTLGVEGIREFRMVTNSFSAEYGMRMGSQMTIVSKSGTNAFHGSLFEFHRNDNLDARNFFDRQTALTPGRLPAFVRNQFGGSVGGPIKKDRTFFYAVYESLRQRLGQTLIFNTIPTSAKVDGGLVPQIAPVIKPFLALYPNPNLPNDQLTFPFSEPTDAHFGQIRGDQSFSANDSLFARYTITDEQKVQAPAMDGYARAQESRFQFATLSETHILSPQALNTARFSFSRTPNLSATGAPTGPQFDFVPGWGMGRLRIPGISDTGSTSISTGYAQNVYTWSDDLYYTKGRHSLKFGSLINRFQTTMIGGTGVRGTVQFANLQEFLLGRPFTYFSITPGSDERKSYRWTTVGFYAQDDFRASSNLTLNLGLRYEFHTEYTERYKHGSAVRDLVHDDFGTVGPPFENPSLKNISPRFGFAWDVRGDGKTAVRGGFGLLYDVAVFSAAIKSAMLATPPFTSQSTRNIPASQPVVLTLPLTYPVDAVGKSLKLLDYHMRQPHLLQYNLTVERQLPFNIGLTLAYAGSRGINLMRRLDGNPTTPQILPDGRKFWTGREPLRNPNWTSINLAAADGNSWYNALQFGLTKRLSHGLQFQSSYTWSKLIDETQGMMSSEDSRQPSDPTDRKVDRAVAGFDLTQNWRFNAIYRMPEFIASGGAAGKILNGWMMTGILSLQTGYPVTPTVTTNRSRSQANLQDGPEDRPDLRPGRSNDNIVRGTTAGCPGVAAGQKLGTPDLYLDPCGFSLQPAGFLGTAGRGILRGPGLANLDFSLVKDTPLGFLGESGKLEFRAEFFNILNRAHFAVPGLPGSGIVRVFAGRTDNDPAIASSATITFTENTSRQIQFGLRVVF